MNNPIYEKKGTYADSSDNYTMDNKRRPNQRSIPLFHCVIIDERADKAVVYPPGTVWTSKDNKNYFVRSDGSLKRMPDEEPKKALLL
jgi:hypothetical protein